MQIRRELLNWGLFLVLLGGIPLAVRGGVLDAELVRNAWNLWPLILVGIGMSLVLRRTPGEALGGLVIAATFGVMLGGLVATGLGSFRGISACNPSGAGSPFPGQRGTFGGGARVALDLNCGDVVVTTAAGSEWTLDGTSEGGNVPRIDTSENRLEIQSRETDGPFLATAESWRLSLPTSTELDLSLVLNAGSADLDLAGARVSDTNLTVNAGSIVLDLAEAVDAGRLEVSVNAGSASISLPVEDLGGSLTVNAGSIEVCVPPSVGIRFRTDESIVASYDFAPRLVQVGNVWESPDFASAEVQIELDASANAGTITLDPEGGCDG